MPDVPSGGASPGDVADSAASGGGASNASEPSSGPNFDAIATSSKQITDASQTIVFSMQTVQNDAAQIHSESGDDESLQNLLNQMLQMAAQAEQDAVQLCLTADEINYRIDNSEETTLALADDIGEMADRIGEMADRILWTELQIGEMADRIVESEYLISESSLELVNEIQETLDSASETATHIADTAAEIAQQTTAP